MAITQYNFGILSDIKTFELNQKDLENQYVMYMLNRTQKIFKYTNLPDTIPKRDLELMLQVYGCVIFTNKDLPGYYVFRGELGGAPNPYYLPTLGIVANPALAYSKTLKIDEDCVVIRNDSMYMGLLPMYKKFAKQLADADLTLSTSIINARLPVIVTADNEQTYNSAVSLLSKINEGKTGVVMSKAFFEGIKTFDFSTSSGTLIKELIEGRQYIIASWFNELGLQANYNMKREAINSSESALNESLLRPLIQDMLEERRVALDKINAMYGLNISVELDSSWSEIEFNPLEYMEKEQEILNRTTEESSDESNDEKDEVK